MTAEQSLQSIIDTLEHAKDRARMMAITNPLGFICLMGCTAATYIQKAEEAQHECRKAINALATQNTN